MAMQAGPADERRKKIRVGGTESVVDVARVVFKDPRVAALITDLNPSLPARGPIAAGVVVIVPSPAEVQAFAKKMGFTLGFNEQGTNGTRQKRAWAKLNGPGQASHSGIDPVDAARKLLSQKVPAAEVGKRLAKLCTPEALERFLAQAPDDPVLSAVWQSAELHVAWPKAHARLLQIVGLLEATLRPGGLLPILESLVADATHADALLQAVLTPPAAQQAFRVLAPQVVARVERARQLAKLERGLRDTELKKDPDAAIVSVLLAAVVDRVEPVSGERLKVLGLDQAWSSFAAHLEMLKETVKKQDALLGRAGNAVVRTLARGEEGAKLPKPWPVIAAVVRGLGPALDAAGAGSLDAGLGGLVKPIKPAGNTGSTPARPAATRGATTDGAGVPPRSMEGAPVLSAASLQARAASSARTVDEGTAIAERLAPRVVALLDLARPLAGDTGPVAMRRARRRSHYDGAILARSQPQGAAVAQHVDELFADARRAKLAGADGLERPQLQAAREIALTLTDTLTVHQKNVSELARALLIVAMALDRELGALLLRPTGREAFRQSVEKHGSKLLSRSAIVYGEPAPAGA